LLNIHGYIFSLLHIIHFFNETIPMKELEKLYEESNHWQTLQGLDIQFNTAKRFCNAEWQEYHQEENKQKKLLELGDVFVVTSNAHRIAKLADIDFPTSYLECVALIRNAGALEYVKAVIASNWTKYMDKRKVSLQRASIEAEKASAMYEGRYTSIVPTLSTDGNYYILIGVTSDGDKKVIKPPSFFVSAEKFLS
jgi:hypothetical protein